MRQANKAIERQNHPLPTMDVLLPQLREAKLFTRLDIKNAFHQIEIGKSSRYITTFISKRGLLRYKRLMFGITCAPEMFQRIMEHMLIDCLGTINFIDDIIIFGATEADHDNNLRNTLQVLKNNNVLLNEAKCMYKTEQIKFLGYQLSAKGIRPLENYINGIKKFREPKTIDELQSFLGLVNFVGKWIPDLSTRTDPMREMLRLKLYKGASIDKYWGQAQRSAFQKLKEELSKNTTLGYYNPFDRTQLIADASPVGLGAILIQFDINGPRIIAYGSKSLTDCERRYCQTEKEALALIWAVEHFNMYLYGKEEFELVTDHKPLEVIFSHRSKPCARIER